MDGKGFIAHYESPNFGNITLTRLQPHNMTGQRPFPPEVTSNTLFWGDFSRLLCICGWWGVRV